MMIAIVVGGAFFGDNLSFISDTTIMATRTQGCELRDKFRANIWIALPAALIALALYCFMGLNVSASSHTSASDFILVLPYLFVLISALCGMNVIGVLCLGTALAGFLGLMRGSFTLIGWMQAMNTGIMGMSELIIVTLMAAGLIEVIRRTNGIEFILQRLTKHIRSSKGAELSMAGLVILTDLCTANNTIAILTVGPLAKEISQQYGIHPRRTASILDTFSCFAQGIIPYGAQLLIASGLAEINPIEIIPHLYYPFILALIALLYILMKKTTQHITYGQDSEILPPSDN
jgi:Na+/H+ antiporter NhaC